VGIWGDTWKKERSTEWSLIAVVDRKQRREVGDRWTGRIAEPELVWRIFFLERATISTIVLAMGYVSARGGLRGEKRVG
jgi:hypothetical protein